jgi:hypothetical protein
VGPPQPYPGAPYPHRPPPHNHSPAHVSLSCIPTLPCPSEGLTPSDLSHAPPPFPAALRHQYRWSTRTAPPTATRPTPLLSRPLARSTAQSATHVDGVAKALWEAAPRRCCKAKPPVHLQQDGAASSAGHSCCKGRRRAGALAPRRCYKARPTVLLSQADDASTAGNSCCKGRRLGYEP